ncbi:CXXX repeat peptide modification system protein [Clostridium gasigenes]|uniref:CXXX repeat peptide modification system protein n=1 Tax=Clostridium gasigenes TaxID=94869 RepID=A0A1H0NW49_9CLOT|nr:CXXX repeat peptide modification system protein [Clostridium gasigenes]MBU3087650.1 CXXX repeat peptide modification system protein [Clostridium gasigenes]SDO96748.1 CXXX repeat peptide modification system protein [Clostridium gasigenes]
MKNNVANITKSESKEIELIIEKSNSLNSLMETLNANDEYSAFKISNIDRINNDYSEINLKMRTWWGEIFSRYELKEVEGFTYTVSCRDESIYMIDKIPGCCIGD